MCVFLRVWVSVFFSLLLILFSFPPSVADHGGKTVFKIVYKTSTGFQKLKFEGESHQVKQIVRKIEYCMKMRSAVVRDEYLAHKQQSRIVRRFSHHSLSGHRS